MSIRVVLADDHKAVRQGFRLLLEGQPDISVAGEAGSGIEAVRIVKELLPDVALIDIAMPKLNGIDATYDICKECPAVKVIILSMYSTPVHVSRAFKAGAQGYILKECAGEDVIRAVRAVHSGRRFLCDELSGLVVDNYIMASGERKQTEDPLSRLSVRERQVLQLIVEGHSNTETAEMLFLSPKTVETYRSHLMQKLGIGDLPALVR
ncbi:MAG: response regulator transcription factor, partial [Syntrophobacteraceae bacterium]|nr:response regulator transcription factor [Syntrophobacteraceae bacterium]